MKPLRPSPYVRKAHARRLAPQGLSPAHQAHTASGREIKGTWQWIERAVLVATFVSVILGIIAFQNEQTARELDREVNRATLTAYEEQSVVNKATLKEFEDSRDLSKATYVAYNEQSQVNRATLAEIEEARKDRQSDAITRAWSLITTPAVGNSGKGPALEYLADQNIRLIGIDLSCTTMGGTLSYAQSGALRCSAGAYLRDVNLSRSNFQNVELVGANLGNATFDEAYLNHTNFSATHLVSSSFRKVIAESTDFSFSTFWNATLTNSSFIGSDFSGALLTKSDFSGSNLRLASFHKADLGNAKFRNANLDGADFRDTKLSGADFTGALNIGKANFDGAQTMSLLRPKGLEDVELSTCRSVKSKAAGKREKVCFVPGETP